MRWLLIGACLLGSSASMAKADTTVSLLRPNLAPVTTVGALPACAAATTGIFYVVTDALLPASLAVVAAGGAVVVPVVCNGTNWIVG